MRFVLGMDIVLLIQFVSIIRETIMYFKLVSCIGSYQICVHD